MAVIISDNTNPKYGTAVATVAVANGGSGYSVSDVLTLAGGDANATCTVLTVDGGGAVLTISRTTVGSGYTAGTENTTVAPAGGSGCTITITVQAGMGTVNGFYRVEAHNLRSIGTALVLSTTRNIPVTFANTGNCQGVVLALWTQGKNNGTTTADLEEIKSPVSMTIANPCVVTYASHGFTDGQQVRFSTTGALPTGITANTKYFTRAVDVDTFNLYDTAAHAIAGGATGRVTTTGTQSGTHSLWVQRATKTLAYNEVNDAAIGGATYGAYITPFVFGTAYAVDTTASKWRFTVYDTGSRYFSLGTSDNTNPFYATWCDNQVSFTDLDTLVIKNQVVIDQSTTLGALLATGVTTAATCCVICKSDDYATEGLLWENPALASYTLAFQGCIIFGNHSMVRIGSETYPIKFAQQAILDFSTIGAGTVQPVFTAAGNYQHNASFWFYGEVPAVAKTTLDGDALSGQDTIKTIDTTGWAVGDKVVVGKQYTMGQGDLAIYEIKTISGKDIVFTANLATYTRKSGGTVLKVGGGVNGSGYGIQFKNTSANSVANSTYHPANFVLSGVELYGCHFYFYQSAGYQYEMALAYRSQWKLVDCLSWNTGTGTNIAPLRDLMIPPLGCLVQRVYTIRGSVNLYIYAYYSSIFSSGVLEIKDCIELNKPFAQAIAYYTGTLNWKGDFQNNIFENQAVGGPGMCIRGLSLICKNNKFWGVGNERGALNVQDVINPTEISGNTFDYCPIGILFSSGSAIGCKDVDSVFGSEAANTYDVKILAGTYIDYELQSPTGDVNVLDTDLALTTPGTRFRITDNNDVAMVHKNYLTYGKMVSTGDGLTDTTVHTAGTGKFAIRFEPTSGTDNLELEYEPPTGDISNTDCGVGVWCLILKEAYWAGTYQLPRLTVEYEDGTTAYCQAAQVASDTVDVSNNGWQYLSVPFRATTNFSKIILTLSARTDATGSDAYVYFDDWGGGNLVNTGFDLWSDGLPLPPAWAFLINAQQFWSALTTTSWGTNSMGEAVKALPTASSIADAVLDEQTSEHTTTGSAGKALSDGSKKIIVIDGGEIPIYES